MKRHVYRIEFSSQHRADESRLIAWALKGLAGWRRHEIAVTEVID